jgi:hypothetical protein
MARIVEKNRYGSENVYEVFGCRTEDNELQFLIYIGAEWKWVAARWYKDAD